MSITDTTSEIMRMTKMGYQTVFIEKDLHNHKEKKLLVERFEPFHDLVYMEHPNGFRIEMTKYSPLPGSSEAAFFVDLEEPGLITLQSASVEADVEFLMQALHFRKEVVTEEETILSFNSPVKKWVCRLKLIDNNCGEKKTYLDSSGFPCLAFISSSILKDSENHLKPGAVDMTDPFQLTVNGKSLLIVMFRLPGGSIGELFEIKNKRVLSK